MKGLKNLNAKQRRNIIIYGAVGLFVIAAWQLSRPGVLTTKAPPVNANNLLGNADSHAMGIASIDRQVQQGQTDNAAMKSQIDQLKQELKQQREGGGAPSAQSGVGTTGTPAFQGTPLPPPPVPTVTGNGVSLPPGYGNSGENGANGQPPAAGAPEIQTWGEGIATKAAGTGTGAQPVTVGQPANDPTPSTDQASDPGAAASQAKSAGPKVFIPAGTMLTGVLLTGVDAPTGRDASSHPIPILIRVKENAILPNEYRADYRECFIVGSAMGDLSSERAYMRGETLSCVARNGGVIQAPLQMWGTGEDGKAGMRGTLVSKQGSILAKAMLAGFASGLGQAFKPQQTTTITSNGNPYPTVPLGTAGRMAGMSGVSTAADQVASYYLQLADAEFPVIEISAGRPVTFIVERGAELAKLEASK
ncbi:TrbI/VirB10 family protein [Rhodanobacter sp. FW106-PBR-R2A-1-13]|uniref:TrbI/VirB10 family protein n=1 Tax=Rhodanobacter sp. FW106-PBR-R2A-1-13 TaxID=3454845 RepID=UPI0034E3E8A5